MLKISASLFSGTIYIHLTIFLFHLVLYFSISFFFYENPFFSVS